jgi:hypothetical protein
MRKAPEIGAFQLFSSKRAAPERRRRPSFDRLVHRNARELDAVGQGDLDLLERSKAVRSVERQARGRRHQYQPSEAFSSGGLFTRLENVTTEAASRPVGANEHCSHPCGLTCGIERSCVAFRVAAERTQDLRAAGWGETGFRACSRQTPCAVSRSRN